MGTDLEGAIRSIPSYVDVADHVLVLVPSLYHFDTGILAERVLVYCLLPPAVFNVRYQDGLSQQTTSWPKISPISKFYLFCALFAVFER